MKLAEYGTFEALISRILHHRHKGEIHLYHGSRDLNGLYWIKEMQQLMAEHANFHYTPCISNGEPPEGIAKGRASDFAVQAQPDLKDWRVYLCGHPEMVNQTKCQAFLNGASMADIYADAFHVASSSID